jgi:hypothetical protein
MMPINEQLDPSDGEAKSAATHVAAALRTDQRAPTYGGNWILGNDKGVYLRATNSSLLGNDETDDDSESVEEFQFPFSSSRQLNEEEDAAAAAESRRREKEEEDLERRREEEKAERDRRNDQEAWHFFAGSISRAHAEALLECDWLLSEGAWLCSDACVVALADSESKARSYCAGRTPRR